MKKAGEKKRNPAGLRVVDAQERPEGEDYVEVDLEDEVWEEEEESPLSPWVTVLTFVGLAVLAAIICMILWHFSHRGDSGEDAQNMQAGAGTSEETDGGPAEDPDEQGSDKTPADPQDEENAGEPSEGREDENTQDAAEKTSGQDEAGGHFNGADTSAGEDTSTNIDTSAGADTSTNVEGENDGGQDVLKEPVQGTAAMAFEDVEETVTPKDVVNLRSVPTTTDEGNIIVQVGNGELLNRSGMNKDTGWSRIEYGGQVLYAVTQYLTTDLDYKPPVQQSNPNRVSTISGRIILFSNCDDWISPKEYVNLRTEPSTTEGESTVSCQLNHGEKAHRTGYSADSGWSRVEYDGKVLYVVTSLMNVVEED